MGNNTGAEKQEKLKGKNLKTNRWHKFQQHVKYYVSHIICSFIRALNNWDSHLTNYSYNPNPKFYEDLAPSKNISDEKVYTEAITWAFRNEEIKNIALTGPYGSGKSSILKSFENTNKQYRYLNISLATFDDKIEKDPEQRKLVETSILQQIFYHVKDKQIPDSRFKRIKRLTRFQQSLITIFFTVWLIAGVYIFKPDFFSKFSWFTDFEKTNHNRLNNILSATFLLGSALGIFFLFRMFRNKRFSKLNLTSGELELAQEESSSILNKYLDEILYFFESTAFNIVIIEDLDRFNDPEIFTKLREINNLINNSRQIDRRVVFIYAVRDDMFVDKSRTKFFDFIIPVIPVINSSNSIDILLQKLSTSNLDSSISEDFINDITLYIDDMRMLKNVINEYIIYKDKIGAALNQDKLLGMIIYKNLYPSDFAVLHINQGKVYSIIEKKAHFVRSLVSDLEQKIMEKENQISIGEKLILKDIKELRSVYINAILESFPKEANLSLVIQGNRYTINQAIEDAQFLRLFNEKNLLYAQSYTNYHTGISFKQIEAKVDPIKSYNEREQEILLKYSEGKLRILEELERLRLEKNQVHEKTLSEILKGESAELIDEIRNDKLLVYLLRYGYIDEMYYSYISYFYEGSITKEDNDFVLSVKNQEGKPFNFKLTKIEQLIKKLRLNEFDLPQVLNYSLLDFIIENKDKYGNHFNKILNQIISKDKDSISFLDSYLSDGKYCDELIKSLSAKWSAFWVYISLESNFSIEKKDHYLSLILQYASIDDIIKLNNNNRLANYISKKKNFVSFLPEIGLHSKIKKLIEKLNIHFEELILPESSESLFDFIYEKNLYKINEKMIQLIIETKSVGQSIDVNKLKTSNYTTIQKSGCNHLLKYIESNIEEYITNVFLALKDNSQESEASLIQLLNNKGLTDEIKVQILEKESALVSDINTVDKDVWKLLLSANSLEPTWPNLIAYYNQTETIDTSLIKYLNLEENYKRLSEQKLEVDSLFSDEVVDNFKDDLVLRYELSDAAYEALLSSFDKSFESLDLEAMSPEKIDTLLMQKKLLLTVEMYDLLKTLFTPRHINLVETYQKTFLQAINNYSLDAVDYEHLLNSNRFSNAEKQAIIETMDDGLITSQSKLANLICAVGIQPNIHLSSVILDKVFKEISTSKKIRLLTVQMNNLSPEEITKYLLMLGQPFSAITTNARPLIDDIEINRELLQALERNSYISSWSYYENRIRVYTKNR